MRPRPHPGHGHTPFPPDFTADLQAPRQWPDLAGTAWRAPHLVAPTFGDLWRLVDALVGAPPQRVLDAGCGTGQFALELARRGHHVVGIDRDRARIAVARRTAAADPQAVRRGPLTYAAGDLAALRLEALRVQAPFDVVLCCRVLHHVPDLDAALRAIARVLRPGGRLVALEFAYDRFDRRCAAWLYQMRRAAQLAGLLPPPFPPDGSPAEAVARLQQEWMATYAGRMRLHPWPRVHRALRSRFRQEHLAWHPYLHWRLIEPLEGGPARAETEAAFARFVADTERYLVEAGDLPGLLCAYVGRPLLRRTPRPVADRVRSLRLRRRRPGAGDAARP